MYSAPAPESWRPFRITRVWGEATSGVQGQIPGQRFKKGSPLEAETLTAETIRQINT